MPPNQRMKLTGAAILVSRGMKVLQAAPAAYPYRSAAESALARKVHRMSQITPNGTDSVALQQAIDQAGQSFGTVQLEPTEYVLNKSIRIDRPVRLIGAGWRPVWEDGQPNGTWFRLGKGNFYEDQYGRRCAVIVGGPGSEVSNIAFRQVHPSDADPGNWDSFTPEPNVAAIYVPVEDVLLSNLFLYNVTHGIFAINAGRIECQRIRGFPLEVGIELDHILDVGRVSNIHFWNYWPTPRAGFGDANPDPRVVNVNNYVLTKGIGLLSYRNDNPQISNYFSLFYKNGMVFGASPRGWGETRRFHLQSVEFDHCVNGIEINAANVSGQAVNVKGMGRGQWSISGLYVNGDGVSLQFTNVEFAEYGQCGVNVTGGNTYVALQNFWLESWNLQGTLAPPPLPPCPGVRAERARITLSGQVRFGDGHGAQSRAAGGDGGFIDG